MAQFILYIMRFAYVLACAPKPDKYELYSKFFEFIEERHNFVKNSCTPERVRKCLVTMKRNTHDSEDFQKRLWNVRKAQERDDEEDFWIRLA